MRSTKNRLMNDIGASTSVAAISESKCSSSSSNSANSNTSRTIENTTNFMDGKSISCTIDYQKFKQSHHHHVLQDYSLQYHTSVIAIESFNLSSFLFHGTPRWIVKAVRLTLFVVSLLPAFIMFAFYYVISSDRIAAPYSKTSSRHYLDIYGSSSSSNPTNNNTGKPVVIFITGGAWIIGYKMWGTLLARALVPFGILVIIPDYRNFPQTNIEGMIHDVDLSIQWTIKNCEEYGGDPQKIVIVGQSAGAHIGTCVLLRKYQQQQEQQQSSEKTTSASSSSWSINQISGFIPTSGPNDLIQMRDILHNNGLDKSIVSAIFCNNLQYYSPTSILKSMIAKAKMQKQKEHGHEQASSMNNSNNISYFPPTCVMQGMIDKTVPYQISVDFYEVLKDFVEITNTGTTTTNNYNDNNTKTSTTTTDELVSLKLYPGWSHTDPILEAPFAGDHKYHKDIYDLVQLWTSMDTTITCTTKTTTTKFNENHPACKRICPLFLVELARFFNPF